MEKIKLLILTTFGLESIAAQELKKLGYNDLKTEDGKIEIEGELKDICRTNIWIRTADRIMLKMGEFQALTFEELFQNVKKIPWEKVITKKGKFPVSHISSVKSKLFSKSDCQAIIKKAIVERLRLHYGIEQFEESAEEYDIRVQIHKDIVTIGIDTSGEGLHRRGYRKFINKAPIKETLAAAMVMISQWDKKSILVDPMCGTGTILIEAGMILKNRAPGSKREFVSENWRIISEKYWIEARDEAYSKEIETVPENIIVGYDIDEEAIRIATENIKNAGMEDIIKIEQKDIRDLKNIGEKGIVITNPPYGERMAEKEEVEELYRDMGKVFRKEFRNWKYYIITPQEEFERIFAKRADKNRKLYNGGIKCYYYQYFK